LSADWAAALAPRNIVRKNSAVGKKKVKAGLLLGILESSRKIKAVIMPEERRCLQQFGDWSRLPRNSQIRLPAGVPSG
jgi:hypothetical protein